MKKVLIIGGAGFIGSHFADSLLGKPEITTVTIYDNFSSGKHWHLSQHKNNKRLSLVEGDIADHKRLQQSMLNHDTVIHLASNPDIARAAKEPAIDFEQGTMLTHYVLEAMRTTGASRLLYASGSGVYGDVGELSIAEDFGPKTPISTYGASKLAGEALISAYAYMFGISGIVFRFGNVVGPRQTHGVGYDFIRKLKANPEELTILGDGLQSKSYVYVTDIINAVLLANEKVKEPFSAFNVATGDYIAVREIAEIAVKKLLGEHAKVKFSFAGGNRGWKGDIPVVRLDIDKICSLGWKCQHTSTEAIDKSLDDLIKDLDRK